MPTTKQRTARYVYGVVRASPRRKPATKGLGGRPLRVVAADGLGALTSEVPDEPLEAGRDELLAHAHVLEKALEHGTVLPMRFGVVMPDDQTVRDELLGANREQLSEQLAEMDGKVEFNLKALYDEEALLREVLAENPEVAKLNAQVRDRPPDAAYYARIQLGELVAGAIEEKRGVDEERILDALAPHVVAMEVGQPMHDRMVVNAAFLLETNRADEFDEELEALAADAHPRIGFKLTGPLPPHSFVELSVGS
jgi:gas vesicle protein GvpL/GvpF